MTTRQLPEPPMLMPGAIYSRQQLQRNLMVSPHTVTEWIRDGLKPLPRSGKNMLFASDDVIAFLRTPKN
jgi:hypothetical protein